MLYLHKEAHVAPNFIGHVWALVIKCNVSYSKQLLILGQHCQGSFSFPELRGFGGCDAVSGVAEI